MGCYRRRVTIVTRALDARSAEARCSLEDEFHHFRVTIQAADGHVTAVHSAPLRTPNSVCPGAGDRLSELVGVPLSGESAAVLVATDQHQQCTHLLDMAGLAVASLALRRPLRDYAIVVPDRVDGRTRAQLFRDGELILDWQVAGMLVEAPAPFAGQGLGAGFTRFTRDLPPDEAEAALVFRRALFVSQGRGVDFSAMGRRGPVGGCWAWQPERMDAIERLPDSRRDFSDRPADLGQGDRDWLDLAQAWGR